MKLAAITEKSEFFSLRENWTRLLEESPANTVYLTWEWLYTWWEIFGDTPQLHIVTIADDNGKLLLIAPFVVSERSQAGLFKSKVLEFLGTGESQSDEVCTNYLDIIAAGNAEEVLRLLAVHIDDGFKKGLWDALDFKSVAVDSAIARLLNNQSNGNLAKRISPPATCALIHLPTQWEDYMKTLSKSWRDQIKRGRKEVAAMGEVLCSAVKGPGEITAAFEEFKVLHQGKWLSHDTGWIFASARFNKFHQQILELFSAKNWVEVHRLKINGKTAAASYKYIYNKTVYFYLPSYDVSLKTKIGLGVIERSYDIEQSIKDGLRFYDFYKAKPNSYKWHLAKEKREVMDFAVHRRNIKYFIISSAKSMKAAIRKVKAGMGSREG